MNTKQHFTVKMFEGTIYEEGYGNVAKKVMIDPGLTLEAKAIYATICSYAYGGEECFPTVDTLLYQLNISKNTFLKHRKMLIEKGYISIKSIRVGSKNRTIYSIEALPERNLKSSKTSEEKLQESSRKTSKNDEDFEIKSIKSRESSQAQNLSLSNIEPVNIWYPNNKNVFNNKKSNNNKSQIIIKEFDSVKELFNFLGIKYWKKYQDKVADLKKSMTNKEIILYLRELADDIAKTNKAENVGKILVKRFMASERNNAPNPIKPENVSESSRQTEARDRQGDTVKDDFVKPESVSEVPAETVNVNIEAVIEGMKKNTTVYNKTGKAVEEIIVGESSEKREDLKKLIALGAKKEKTSSNI